MRGRRKPSDEYETYDAESFTSGRQDSGNAIDYDRLFQQTGPTANGGVGRSTRGARDARGAPAPGIGGYTNSRGYPAALDGGYASPPMRRAGGGGQYGYVNSSFSGREGVLQPNGTRHLGPNNTASAASATAGSGPGVPLSSNATTTFIIPSLANMNSNNSTAATTNNSNTKNSNHNNNKIRSAPYTKFQVASPPSFQGHHATSTVGTIPIVQLTTSPAPQGLNIATVDREWERRGSRGSLRSQNSNKSSGGGGSTRSRRRSSISRFLGVGTESAWTKWSKDRRASYRRRVERMENAELQEPELDINRVSTPVKKARQEGMKFVHPDLEERYLSADDMNELRRARQQQVHAMRVIEKNRKKKFPLKAEVKLSEEEWHALQEFWEHRLFLQARLIGMLVSLVAICVLIASIASTSWISHSRLNATATIVEGLWRNCTEVPNEGESCSWTDGRGFHGGLWDHCYQNLSDAQAISLCTGRRQHWQNAVIGLMIFASAFGFLASVLSFCGACTNPLPRKIYYFHSAGEIFFISALSATIALLIFPISVEIDSSVASHSYGLGYGLGWGGAFFFLAAAICMSLDDLVRECSRSRCCRWCWRGRHGDRGDLRQV